MKKEIMNVECRMLNVEVKKKGKLEMKNEK
jgi:hypothetical protein